MSDWREAAVQAVDALEKAADALRQAIGEHDMAEYQRLDAHEGATYAPQRNLLLTDAPQKKNPHREKPSRGSGRGCYPRRGW